MAALRVSTLEQLRAVEPEKLVTLGQTPRTTDDGVFLRKGWKECISAEDHHHHHHRAEERLRSVSVSGRKLHPSPHPYRQAAAPLLHLPPNLQPLIIGDCSYDALLWSLPASLWTPGGVVRRIKAVCQSLTRASALLRAYDISSHTPPEELGERVLELIGDARVAWPTECVAQGARRARGGRGVWRYVFDQEGASRGVPHHAADLMYLFDNVPLPAAVRPPAGAGAVGAADAFCEWDGHFDDDDDEDLKFESVIRDDDEGEDDWGITPVDAWSYARVRDTIQERWIAFAHGEAPWSEDKVYVFGPEGETGERSSCIFEGRRRKGVWKEALEPLGMQLVQKVGVELSRGPPLGCAGMVNFDD